MVPVAVLPGAMVARSEDDAVGGVEEHLLERRGRSPLQTRAAVAVSGCRRGPTRTMS